MTARPACVIYLCEMETSSIRHCATIDDLVRRERETGERYELYNGTLFLVEGARFAHSVIGANLICELSGALQGSDCVVLGPKGRVLSSTRNETEADLYTFPDVSVVCGEPELGPPPDTVLNPSLLAEIVSDSTEAYDRGQKFAFYRRIASVNTYLLIAQDRRAVEVFEKDEDGVWTLREDDSETITLRHLGVTLTLDALYARVPLGEPPPLHPPADA